MEKVESFKLDHNKVKAPFVRKCCVLEGKMGDKVSKFDLRFLQPNKEAFGTAAMHGLEHLLATYLSPASPGGSSRLASSLTQDPLKVLHVRFCTCPLRVESLFPTSFWLSVPKPCWPSRPDVLKAHLPVQDLWAGDPDVWLRPFTP